MGKRPWLVAAPFAAYAALYWPHVIAAGMPLAGQFSYFMGSCAVICMSLGLVLSARPRAVERWFGGLDRMYQVHKYLGVAMLLLVFAHFLTIPGGGPPEEPPAAPVAAAEAPAPTAPSAPAAPPAPPAAEFELPIDTVGRVALAGFVLLLILTLNRKVPYHRWYSTHRLMGLFFAVAALHVFLVLYDGEELALGSPPGAALAVLLLAGLAAYAWRQLFQAGRERRPFTVAQVNRLERATEVVLEPAGAMFRFEPGQFAFVTIDADGFREAHPFTISSGAREGRLRFTMKALGDYTRRVRESLAAGAKASIEGPYGRFNPLTGEAKQVWVAGGIGITPFLSVLRSMEPGHGKTVRLYYCVRTAAEALFLDELTAQAGAAGGVTVLPIDSEKGLRLDAETIRKELHGEHGEWGYYFCGPKPLVEAVTAGLIGHGVSERRIHTEEFEFR